MTQVSRDTVVKLAALSNLQLKDDEIDSLQADISHILAYVEQLNELDTEGVEPAYQVTGLKNIYREDTVDQGDVGRDALLGLAAETQAMHIKVPKVI
jgi:aspartyl-tRNA(Asn)/glutamyl-tRNA(Gln) amidotransferase subunit C